MSIVIDVLLLAVFALLTFLGWRRGFVKSVFRLGRLLLSFVITVTVGPTVSAWIDRRFVNPPVYESVSKKFSEIASDVSATAEDSVDLLVEKIPPSFREHLDLTSVDPTADVTALAESWSRTVSDGISGVIAAVIGYILLFILSFVLLTVVIFLVGKLIDLIPLVRTVDKILGLAVGALIGALTVCLLSMILGALLGSIGQDDLAENSLLLRFFADLKDRLIFPE